MTTDQVEKKAKFKGLLTLVLALVAAVFLLVYFLPRETKFGYEYEKGRPWRYNSLIASFDFPIYKTPGEVAEERDSVLKNFRPYYVKKGTVAEEQTAAFRMDFLHGDYPNVPANYMNQVERMLKAVYKTGVLTSDEISRMAKSQIPGIHILEGTEAIPHPLSEFYSRRSAYEYIVNADTSRYRRDLLAQCNINKYLEANLVVDSVKTRVAREDLISSVSAAKGMVQSGQLIIDKGEIISEQQYQILRSFEYEVVRRNDPTKGFWLVIFGQVVFVLAVLAAFVGYLRYFRRDFLRSPHTILLLASLIVFFPIVTYVMIDNNFYDVYIIPYAMVPIFVRIFIDSRTAFMSMICSIILSSMALHSNYEFIVVQFVAGMTAICALKELSERSQLLRVVFYVFISSAVVMLGYDFSQGIDLEHIESTTYLYLAVNGVLLLFAYPLLYMIEKIFGFTSNVTLVELSNTNNVIFRRMSKVAQGTFVHSLQVANLAAEVANKIGAKSQLVRTGALYHDIGKMLNPAFFTENQKGVNPHDELSEEESARIIINHVTEGVRLAEKYHIPSEIREFIVTHHGHSQVKYFYIQWKNKHPELEPDEAAFTYPGTNPFTLEQAILMMCDAVEASSRSLTEYSEEKISELVNRIIDGQVQAGCFKECPITFRDIADAKRVLVESLKIMYHTRIAYPKLNDNSAVRIRRKPNRGYFFSRYNRNESNGD